MIDPTESLDEYLEAQNAPPEPFAITDDNLADWAAAKIIRKLAEIEANEKLAKLRKQQIDDWLAVTTASAESSIISLTERLRPYLVTRLAGQKTKSLKLPSGVVSLRAANPEFTIDGEPVKADNQRLLEFVQRTNPDFLKIKETVDWSALKGTLITMETGRVITTDGEIVDFIQAYQPPDKINVKGALR